MDLETYARCKKLIKQAGGITEEQALNAVKAYFASNPDAIVTNDELTTILTNYQKSLTAGTGIKIDENNKITIDDAGGIAIYDSRVEDADDWLTNGYVKTSASIPTANLPSVCTGKDKWGVLLYVAENNDNKAGLQQYFPIDGTYKGRVFYRSVTGASSPEFGEWNMVPWLSEVEEKLTTKINNLTEATNDYYGLEGSATYSQYGKLVILNFTVNCKSVVSSWWQNIISDIPEPLNTNEMIIDCVSRSGGTPIRVKVKPTDKMVSVAGGAVSSSWTDYYDVCYTYIAK